MTERTMQERARAKPWPDPTLEMTKTPLFEAIWQVIKDWDINVPGAYVGYMGATGNHARAILEAVQLQLAAARDDGKRALTWTREKPTEPGWYWLKVGSGNGTIMRVSAFDIRDARFGTAVEFEWAGPIPEPEQAKPAGAR